MKLNIDKLVRKNILNLKPYSSARDEFSGTEGIFLDANENPFGTWNRYPDPYQKILKQRLSNIKNIPTENIFIGNGSDEVIDLAFRIFCEPGTDKALTFSPTYGMYEVSAAINDVTLLKIPLTDDFQIDVDVTLEYLKKKQPKIVFICTPNNPTGNLISKESIIMILKQFNGIVFIDEAYTDFNDAESWINAISTFPNLIISQTFSKARGLAAARVGMAFAHETIIRFYNKVKPPYNVSGLNQEATLQSLNAPEVFEKNLDLLLREKEWLKKELVTIPLVEKIHPSDANFLLVQVKNADWVYDELVKRKIIIRNRNTVVKNCIRITIGSPEENKILINTLKEWS